MVLCRYVFASFSHWHKCECIVYQSAIIYFIIFYAYITVSSRPDGWNVNLYEFSTVCPLSLPYVSLFIFIFPADYGFRCCHSYQFIQRPEHQYLDWLGLLFCLYRDCPALDIHSAYFPA